MSKASKVSAAAVQSLTATLLSCLINCVPPFSPQPQKIVQEVPEEQVRKTKSFRACWFLRIGFDASVWQLGTQTCLVHYSGCRMQKSS